MILVVVRKECYVLFQDKGEKTDVDSAFFILSQKKISGLSSSTESSVCGLFGKEE